MREKIAKIKKGPKHCCCDAWSGDGPYIWHHCFRTTNKITASFWLHDIAVMAGWGTVKLSEAISTEYHKLSLCIVRAHVKIEKCFIFNEESDDRPMNYRWSLFSPPRFLDRNYTFSVGVCLRDGSYWSWLVNNTRWNRIGWRWYPTTGSDQNQHLKTGVAMFCGCFTPRLSLESMSNDKGTFSVRGVEGFDKITPYRHFWLHAFLYCLFMHVVWHMAAHSIYWHNHLFEDLKSCQLCSLWTVRNFRRPIMSACV